MSRYDKDREKLGLKPSSTSNAAEEKKASKYDVEREQIFNPQPVVQQQKADPGYTYQPIKNNIMDYPGLQQITNSPVSIPEPEQSSFEARKDTPSRNIPVIGPVLKTLDRFSDTKVQNFIGDVGQTLYTPGAGLANVAGFAGAVGSKLTQKLPNLTSTLGGRVAQEAIKEGVTGVPLGVGQSLATGETDLGEAAKQGLIGGVAGAGLGAAMPLVGAGVKRLLSRPQLTEALPSYDGLSLTRPMPEGINQPRQAYKSNDFMGPTRSDQEIIDAVNKEAAERRAIQKAEIESNVPAQREVPPSKYSTEREAIKQVEIKPIANVEPAKIEAMVEPAKIEPMTDTQKTIAELDEDLKSYKDNINSQVQSGAIHRETASKSIYGRSMAVAAEKRNLIQGDSLIPVDGGFTGKELSNKIAKLKTNYAGKEVTVDGMDGTITKNSFGKVGVQFADGTEKFFMPEQITAKTNVDDLIKQQNAAKVEPVQPKIEPIKNVEDEAKVTARRENVAQGRKDLEEISAEIENVKTAYQNEVNKNYEYLKDSMTTRGGVIQGQLIKNADGEVINRVGRISDNPKWYQEFYKENGRKPTNSDLRTLAIKYTEEGVSVEGGTSPSWTKENNYHETMDALEQFKTQLSKSLDELEQVDRPIAPKQEPTPISKYAEERAKLTQPVTGERERGFVTTLKDSPKPPLGVKGKLKAAYNPITNQSSVNLANKRIKDLEDAASYVMGKSKFTAEKVTTAHRLIDEFSKSGNHQRAVDIAEKIAEEGTRAGQSIQAFSIYNRLTPEGVLVHAQRVAAKTNDTLNVLQKEVKVTADVAAHLTDLAATTRAMTGVKDLSNDVMDILDRAKSGAKLTAEDSETLQKFVTESRQFIKEVEKKPVIKPPTEVKDKRVKDNLIKFLDKQEEAAKERLRSKGIRISSMPLDIYADYAVIGAAKMARGTIKFADWSVDMIKDFGEEVRPLLENIYNKAAETMNQSAKKVTQSSVSNAERIVNNLIKKGELQGEEAEQIRTLAEKVSNLSGDAKNLASQDLQFILQQLERPSALKKVSSAQTIAQLLNPKTQVRNALGNEMFYRLERINKLVTAPIDWGRVKLFGGQRSVTFKTNNQGEYWKNWLLGLKAGWRGVNVEGLQTQFDIGPAAFNGKWNPLTYMEKALGASLKSFDTAAYKRAVNNTIGEMATLRAINEGLTGEAKKAAIQNYIRNVDDHVLKISDDYGKYSTFQDNNLISRGLVGLKRGLNFGKDFGIGDLVLKYPKTPGALLMRALEYSPAGFLRSASIAAKPFFKKEPNTAEAMQALSRAMVGTLGLSGMGWYLMKSDILTGAASKDADVRDLQRSAGQGQYQVNLSALKRWALSGFDPKEAKLQEGDNLYTYDWMQPVAIAVSVGANAGKAIEEKKTKGEAAIGLAGAAYGSLEGGLNSLVETSVLSGVKRAFTSYPGQSVTDKIADILASAPASFVPTAVNQSKQLIDNAQRETYDPNKLQQAFNQLKIKVPGVSTLLPQRYDTLGDKKITYQNNSFFNVLLNPGFASEYKLTPEAKMVVKLITDTGDTSVAPRVPGKTITVHNEKGEPSSKKLTTEQFTDLQRLTGEETVRLLRLIPPDFTNDQKLKAIAAMLTDAGKKARYDLQQRMGVQ